MLAPPAIRAGVSKGPGGVARSRLVAEQKARAEAQQQQNAAAAASSHYHPHHDAVSPRGASATYSHAGSTIQVQPRNVGSPSGHSGLSPSSGVRRRASSGVAASSAPLHLRMVQEVEFVVYPFSLMFYDPACEVDYLRCAGARSPRHILRVALGLVLLFSVGLAFEASTLQDLSSGPNHQSLHDVYRTRVVLQAVALGLAVIFALSSRLAVPYRPRPQLAMTALLTACGCLWAAASVFGNDVLLRHGEIRTTEAASLIVFLLVIHGAGRCLFFHLSCVPSGASVIVYIVLAVVYSSSAEPRLRVAWHCLLAAMSLCLCWFVSYRLEVLKRLNHVNELKVELGRREKADLKKEAFDLRDEMYVMTLERYDIADVDKRELEFKSPMEQAMAKLQAMSENKTLPKDAFLELQKVIGLLGTSDVFKVQVADQLADRNIRLDHETTRYLFDLVNSNDQMSFDESVQAGSMRVDVENAGVGAEDVSSSMVVGSSGLTSGADRSPTGATAAGRFSSPSVPAPVLAKEEKAINDLLLNMDSYNFDVFEVAALTQGQPLFFVGTALFKKYNLLAKFRIDRDKLSNFLSVLEASYLRTNPYHNSVHAADVARTVHYFLHTSMRPYTTDLEIMALIVASLIHDVDHPGKTNAFHVVVRDPLALVYNDRSVLENHHCSVSYFLLNKPENNIFSELSQKDYTQIRKIIVELVLATDLSAHFDFLAQFKSSVGSGSLDSQADKLIGPHAYANRLMIHKMALKTADLGHSTKTLVLHEKWTHRITEEFYRQGDEERKRSLPISPFMDRTKANMPASQVGFLDYLVIPLFSVWVKFLDLDDATCPLMSQLKNNKEHWKSLLDQTNGNGSGDKDKSTDQQQAPSHGSSNSVVIPSATSEHRKHSLSSVPPPAAGAPVAPSSLVPQDPWPVGGRYSRAGSLIVDKEKDSAGDGSNKVAPAPHTPTPTTARTETRGTDTPDN